MTTYAFTKILNEGEIAMLNNALNYYIVNEEKIINIEKKKEQPFSSYYSGYEFHSIISLENAKYILESLYEKQKIKNIALIKMKIKFSESKMITINLAIKSYLHHCEFSLKSLAEKESPLSNTYNSSKYAFLNDLDHAKNLLRRLYKNPIQQSGNSFIPSLEKFKTLLLSVNK